MSFISSVFTKLVQDLVINKLLNKNNNSCIKAEKNIKKSLRQPTNETVFYSVQFAIGEFLLYLFPNSFTNVEEAEKYYLNFCQKAQEYNECSELYKKVWVDGVVKVDLLSNMKLYWDSTVKDFATGLDFKLFTPFNVKNEKLKKEIEKLYNDNLEHLQNINFLPRDRDLTGLILFCIDSIWITPSGIEWTNWNKWGLSEKSYLGFPTNSFLKLLRINEVYDLNRAERKELIKQFKKWHKKRPYKFKLNFQENSIQLDNQFIRVNLYTKYGYVEEIDDFPYGYKVQNIDLF